MKRALCAVCFATFALSSLSALANEEVCLSLKQWNILVDSEKLASDYVILGKGTKKEHARQVGVGIVFGVNAINEAVVRFVAPQSPAARASVTVGDELFSVEGIVLKEGAPPDEAIQKIGQGKQGTLARFATRNRATNVVREYTIQREMLDFTYEFECVRLKKKGQ